MRTLMVNMLLMVLLAGSTRAQAVRDLTPEEAVALGLQRGHAVQAADAASEAAAARYQQARTLRLPVLSGQGSYSRFSSNIPDFAVRLPAGSGGATGGFEVPAVLNRYNLQLSVQQPLFTGFRLQSSIRAASYQAEAAQEQGVQAQADHTLQIQQVYWDFYKAAAVRDVVGEAVQQVEVYLQDVRHLRAQGMATNRDVLAVEARLAEVQLDQVDAEHAVRLAGLRLNQLVGLPLETEVRAAASVAAEPLAADVGTLVAQALERRPELAALGYQTQALGAQVRAAQASYWPQVALVGNYRYARPNPYIFPIQDEFDGTWDVGVAVSMDLWTWGRTRAQVQEAQAQQRQVEELRAQVREAVELEVHQAYLNVQRALEAVQVARQAQQAAAESHRVTQSQFREGLALNADVLDAEVAYRNAETRYQQALADYAAARASLDWAVGVSPAASR